MAYRQKNNSHNVILPNFKPSTRTLRPGQVMSHAR